MTTFGREGVPGRQSRPVPAGRRQRQLTVTAAAATLLGALPLSTVFTQWTWLVDAFLVVTALCVIAVLLRGVRVPAWVPTAAMIAALPVLMARQSPSHQELLGIIPTAATLRHFGELLGTAASEMRQYSTPTPDRPGFLFLSTLGVAAVAILIDLFTVVLRRPAIAGLPMLAMYSVPVAVREGSVNLVPFALGAGGFLWLLIADNIDKVRRFGRRFSGDGRGIEVWETSPLAAAGQRIGLIGIVLAIGVPIAIPGMTSGLLERFIPGAGSGAGTGGNGSGTTVGLYAMLSGNLVRDKSFEMVRVQTNDPNPYYLRLAVADQLTNTGFRNKAVSGGDLVAGGLPPVGPAPSGVTQRGFRASVEIVDLDSQYLPVYQQPTKVDRLDRSWLYDAGTSTIYSTRQNTHKKRYAFDYVRAEYSPAALRTAGPAGRDEGIGKDVVTVPAVPEVESRVNQLVAGKQTQYDKVVAILNYFSPTNGFSYSKQTQAGTSGTQIMDFLSNKRGFCVQYSAAMAWLVRQAGYPARVAFGFTRGSGQPGSVMSLTNHNLHAWTEVYFSGFGWIPFDATPATGVAGSVSPNWAPNPSRPNDVSTATAQPGTAASAGPQSSAGAAPRADQQANQQAVPGTATESRRAVQHWPVWTILGLVALLGLLAVPAWHRRHRRRARLRTRAATTATDFDGDVPPGTPVVVGTEADRWEAARRDAHAAWDELLDTMIDYGIPVDPAETPRATAARLATVLTPSAVTTVTLTAPQPSATAVGITGLVGASGLAGGSGPAGASGGAKTEPVAVAGADRAVAGARELGRAEEQARYSNRPRPNGELARSLGAVTGALAERSNRWTRLRVRVLPPSVLRRWRNTVNQRADRLATALAQLSPTNRRLSRQSPDTDA